MSDPRAEKLAKLWDYAVLEPAINAIQAMESAGLTVIDTTDEATIDRVAQVLFAEYAARTSVAYRWEQITPGSKLVYTLAARRALAALRGDS